MFLNTTVVVFWSSCAISDSWNYAPCPRVFCIIANKTVSRWVHLYHCRTLDISKYVGVREEKTPDCQAWNELILVLVQQEVPFCSLLLLLLLLVLTSEQTPSHE